MPAGTTTRCTGAGVGTLTSPSHSYLDVSYRVVGTVTTLPCTRLSSRRAFILASDRCSTTPAPPPPPHAPAAAARCCDHPPPAARRPPLRGGECVASASSGGEITWLHSIPLSFYPCKGPGPVEPPFSIQGKTFARASSLCNFFFGQLPGYLKHGGKLYTRKAVPPIHHLAILCRLC